MEFHLDVVKEALPMRAAIRVLVFEVAEVDAVSFKYRWIQIAL
jgi:hypothetical protein